MAESVEKMPLTGVEAPVTPPSTPGRSKTVRPSPPNSQPEQRIYLPDMFSSIMSVDAAVNPNYFKVKSKGDAWFSKTVKADKKWTEKDKSVDYAYLSSLWAPNCDAENLRIVLDWNHWVFSFDDMFDEGHCSQSLAAAQAEINVMVGIMEGTQPRADPTEPGVEHPLRYVYQTVMDRVNKTASPEFKQHWKEMHQRYFDGILEQVKVVEGKRTFTRDVNEFMAMRRGNIGVYPAIALVEYCEGVRLPLAVLDHPSLQECMCVSADLVALVNDVISYKKDLMLGGDQNIIMLLMDQGLSIQQAVDQVGNMFTDCYKRWYTAHANLPQWGEEIDGMVLRFMEVCRNVALGNLYWSHKTARYLTTEDGDLRDTKVLILPG